MQRRRKLFERSLKESNRKKRRVSEGEIIREALDKELTS